MKQYHKKDIISKIASYNIVYIYLKKTFSSYKYPKHVKKMPRQNSKKKIKFSPANLLLLVNNGVICYVNVNEINKRMNITPPYNTIILPYSCVFSEMSKCFIVESYLF